MGEVWRRCITRHASIRLPSGRHDSSAQTHQPPVPVPARGQEAGGRVASGEVLTPFPSASPFLRPGQHHGEAALDLGGLVPVLADGSVSPVR